MITEDPRFAGIGRLYGTEALARLACSHVVVVGIGGPLSTRYGRGITRHTLLSNLCGQAPLIRRVP